MPMMPRQNGKAKRIAQHVLGKPPNMQYYRRTKRKRERNHKLLVEEGHNRNNR